MNKLFADIRTRVEAATAGPWGPYAANVPFYAQVTKPAPSLSKHNNPTYWRIEDASFVAASRIDIPKLLEAIDVMHEALTKIHTRSGAFDALIDKHSEDKGRWAAEALVKVASLEGE